MENNMTPAGSIQGNSGVKSRSRSEVAFRRIAIALFFQQRNVDISEHYAYVKKLFGLRRMKAEMLSLLLFREIGSTDASATGDYISVPVPLLLEVWEELEKEGFVTQRRRPGARKFGYEIRRNFRIAVRDDIPLPDARKVLSGEEFLSSLKLFLHGESGKAPFHRGKPAPFTFRPANNETIQYEINDEASDDSDTDDCTPVCQGPGNPGVMDSWLAEFAGTPVVESVRRLSADLDSRAKNLLYGMMGWFAENFTMAARREDLPVGIRAGFEQGLDTLIQKGLVVSVYVCEEKFKSSGSGRYRISPRCAEVFRGMENRLNMSVLAQFGTLVSSDEIQPRELFYPEQDMRNIARLRAAAQPDEYGRIIDALKAAGMRPCLSALLWGAPGTGKTELARQIARDSGRSILLVDVPKVIGIYIGEGSIRLRDLFQTYRYVCAVSRLSPILFMDEADAILGRRLSSLRSASDKDSNNTQSVILDELNSMPGIFIATTNLIRNLDDAMIRRFMIKAEFHLPDATTRAHLWRSKFPSLSPEEAKELSEQYNVSGGVIDNIVSIAIVEGILDKRAVTVSDLRSYCEEQGLGKSRSLRIGF